MAGVRREVGREVRAVLTRRLTAPGGGDDGGDGSDGNGDDHGGGGDGSDDHYGGDDDYPTEKVQQTPKPPAQVPFKVSRLNSIPFIFKFSNFVKRASTKLK